MMYRPPRKSARQAGGQKGKALKAVGCLAQVRRNQFNVTWSGWPLLSLTSLDHIASIALITLSGIGT
jgi:hypothetical protein